MIRIDEEALSILDGYFNDHPLSPVRIYVSTRMRNGPSLALIPDQEGSRDLQFEVDGYTFIISERLAQQVGDVYIAAHNSGFKITAERPLLQH